MEVRRAEVLGDWATFRRDTELTEDTESTEGGSGIFAKKIKGFLAISSGIGAGGAI